MEKEDKIIEILAWLCIIAVVVFCIRFNYELKHDVGTVQDYNTSEYNQVGL